MVALESPYYAVIFAERWGISASAGSVAVIVMTRLEQAAIITAPGPVEPLAAGVQRSVLTEFIKLCLP